MADPEKRTPKDILRALELVGQFEQYFNVILGLNEKEAYEISNVLGLSSKSRSRDQLSLLVGDIQQRIAISTLVVHPVAYALAVSESVVSLVEGPYVDKPLITTGAGDHFNSGFCLGKLLGFDNAASILLGVTTSGFYVRTAKSPAIEDLAQMLRHWPQN